MTDTTDTMVSATAGGRTTWAPTLLRVGLLLTLLGLLATGAPCSAPPGPGPALGWAALGLGAILLPAAPALVLATAVVAGSALTVAWLRQRGQPPAAAQPDSAPPRHAISGAVALLAGSLQLRLATRLLGGADTCTGASARPTSGRHGPPASAASASPPSSTSASPPRRPSPASPCCGW